MSIESLANACSFCDVDIKGSFTITAVNDVLVLTSDQGGPCDIDIPDNVYEGSELATALQTAMNADATLTGGVITFVVSYSATTYKFTIDATAGHTIAYTHSGSDGGLTCGFSQNHTAAQTITSDNAVPGNPANMVQTLLNAVDAWCKEYCDQAFESVTYAELSSGKGSKYLRLKQRPVTAITQLSIGRDNAIKVKNTAADATNAYVKVDSTKVTLVVLGGTSASSSEVDYATYKTLTAVVTQINTLGKGWVAALADSDLAAILSTQLIACESLYCGARANTTASYEYLEIPSTPVGGFKYKGNIGEIYLVSGFPKGYQNIYIGYTAGYSAALMPHDLKLSISVAVKHLYDRRDEDGFGKESIAVAGLSQKYVELLPEETLAVWQSYRLLRI